MAQLDLEKIKQRRLEKDKSLLYMSGKLGFKNASTYLKYERGDYSFDANMLPILAEELECNIEYFFTQKVAEIEIE